MSDVVVDSSVAVKWALTEADTAQANRLSSEVRLRGGRLIVLDLALVEMGNAIWKHFHRRIIGQDEARAHYERFSLCPFMSNRPDRFFLQRWKSP